jgi:hypothetical protein
LHISMRQESRKFGNEWQRAFTEFNRLPTASVSQPCQQLGRSGLRKTRTAGVPAEIRTEHLPDTSIQRYRYADLIC